MKLDAILEEITETGEAKEKSSPMRTISVTNYFDLKEQISVQENNYFASTIERKKEDNYFELKNSKKRRSSD